MDFIATMLHPLSSWSPSTAVFSLYFVMRIVVATVPKKPRMLCVAERPFSSVEDASSNVFTRFPSQHKREIV